MPSVMIWGRDRPSRTPRWDSRDSRTGDSPVSADADELVIVHPLRAGCSWIHHPVALASRAVEPRAWLPGELPATPARTPTRVGSTWKGLVSAQASTAGGLSTTPVESLRSRLPAWIDSPRPRSFHPWSVQSPFPLWRHAWRRRGVPRLPRRSSRPGDPPPRQLPHRQRPRRHHHLHCRSHYRRRSRPPIRPGRRLVRSRPVARRRSRCRCRVDLRCCPRHRSIAAAVLTAGSGRAG